jgi:hypothetical protein
MPPNPPPIHPEGPFRCFQREAQRPPAESPLYRPAHPPIAPSGPLPDPRAYESFLREETIVRKRRWKRHSRQTLAWVLACASLPVLILVLDFFFF